MLTKKNYIALATVIRELPKYEGVVRVSDLIDRLSEHLLDDNQKFNITQFKLACQEIGVYKERPNVNR